MGGTQEIQGMEMIEMFVSLVERVDSIFVNNIRILSVRQYDCLAGL